MALFDSNLLSIITFLPLFGAIAVMGFERGNSPGARGFALFISGINFFLSLLLWHRFDANSANLQFVERASWIPSLGAQYLLGVDGISLFLVLLTTFLTVIVIVQSYSGVTDKVREYLAFMLALETAMLGALVAQDMLLFYMFWEAMLIPMYFLIGIFGGKNRVYATVKFFLFTMAGSVLMLVAILFLYFKAPTSVMRTFELAALTKNTLDLQTQRWLFLAFALSFAIKVPMFPVHTWLPDAHVEAPTGGSVILAGVLLKMGTYGFLRFAMPLFPRAAHEFLPVIAALAVIGIIYGALVSMVQKDMKKVVAYSSVSHLGFVMLGIAAMSTTAVSGAVYQMLNHGISTGALFLLVGVIYERRHTRSIKDFGGLAAVMPSYAMIFLLMALSSIGLPGLNGFIGEFLILAGTAKSHFLDPWRQLTSPSLLMSSLAHCGVLFAALGVILAAVYMLSMYRRIFFGKVMHPENHGLKDLSLREKLMFAPLIILVVVMGVLPQSILHPIDVSVQKVIADFEIANHAAARPTQEPQFHVLPSPPGTLLPQGSGIQLPHLQQQPIVPLPTPPTQNTGAVP